VIKIVAIDRRLPSRLADAKVDLVFLRQQYPEVPLGVVGLSLGGSTTITLNPAMHYDGRVIKHTVQWMADTL